MVTGAAEISSTTVVVLVKSASINQWATLTQKLAILSTSNRTDSKQQSKSSCLSRIQTPGSSMQPETLTSSLLTSCYLL